MNQQSGTEVERTAEGPPKRRDKVFDHDGGDAPIAVDLTCFVDLYFKWADPVRPLPRGSADL